MVGEDGTEPPPAGPVLVPTLKAAVERATGRPIAPDYDAGAIARDAAARLEPGRHALRGLFCGGTLATEAHAVLAGAGVAVVLLDMVLGLGAHAHPARPISDAVPEAGGPAVVASVCGTRGDPQDYEHQAAMLGDAGVIVAPSNADAAAVAAMILGHGR